jgi:hypothetical protein
LIVNHPFHVCGGGSLQRGPDARQGRFNSLMGLFAMALTLWTRCYLVEELDLL